MSWCVYFGWWNLRQRADGHGDGLRVGVGDGDADLGNASGLGGIGSFATELVRLLAWHL